MVQYCILGYEKITDVRTLSFRWILPFWYFCFIFEYTASLDLYVKRKQKYQNGNIHRKLRVPTSEREGKLSNLRTRAPRARDAWRKFQEIYGNPRGRAVRAPCIDFLAAKYTISILGTTAVPLKWEERREHSCTRVADRPGVHTHITRTKFCRSKFMYWRVH
jgi:hypothetical protein